MYNIKYENEETLFQKDVQKTNITPERCQEIGNLFCANKRFYLMKKQPFVWNKEKISKKKQKRIYLLRHRHNVQKIRMYMKIWREEIEDVVLLEIGHLQLDLTRNHSA